MSINYTNRKGVTYTLYKGQTKTGKPRYYFGRSSQNQDEPVTEIPAGFKISESINGIVSLVKDRPSQIQPEEMAVVEGTIKQHPQARLYRAVAKDNQIEIYEQVGPSYDTLLNELDLFGRLGSGQIKQLQDEEERHAQYSPVLRFNLLDPKRREFGAERMCYRSSIDGWLKLYQTGGSIEKLASDLIPTLGTDQFYELW